MNSAKFTWEKYIGRVGFALTEVWNLKTNRALPGFTELGRCAASSLPVRPRSQGEAVMLLCEETGEEFWLHAFSDELIGFLEF